MLRRYTDFDRPLDVFAELRRQMDQVWEDFDASASPRLSLSDAGESLLVEADVPGITEKEIDLTLGDGVLVVTAERKLHDPEGYAPRRNERAAFRFSRSVTLPCRVDPEKTTASVKDGVLSIRLMKAEEARPRQIRVKVQG